MKKSFPVLFLLLLIPVLAQAQTATTTSTTTTTGPKTIEEKRLQSTVEVQVISSLVAENGRNEKLRALDFLRSMVEKGKVNDKSTEVIGLLEELGSEGTTKQVVENRRVINDFPEIRRESAELLGRVGGDQSREVLINMAIKDKEPMVISEAVYSLGLVGGGSQLPRVLTVISSLVKSQDAIKPDSNFAYAAVSALEMLGKQNKGQLGPEAMAALVQISKGNYIRPVREKAKAVLDDLLKY